MNMKELFFEFYDRSLKGIFLWKRDFDRVDSRLIESSFSSMNPNDPNVHTHNIIRLTHDHVEIRLGLQLLNL